MSWKKLPKELEGKVQSEVGGDEENANKMHNTETVVDGKKFQSKLEARYYKKLIALKAAGEIEELELQPKLPLQPGFDDKNGEHHYPISYYPDFRIVWKDGKEEYVDTKGHQTQVYKIKKKLMLFKYPDINFREVYTEDLRGW